jgi:predicted TPR repeat methyltransferase
VHGMDSAPLDKRGYPVVSAQTGYAEWADHYDSTVAAELDRPALLGLNQIDWKSVQTALDLACGTGRTGTWLSEHGVGLVNGIDITDEMRRIAEAKGVYRRLYRADIAATGLPSASYDLCTLFWRTNISPVSNRYTTRQPGCSGRQGILFWSDTILSFS